MQKVEIQICGKRALVDADQVKLHRQKQALLQEWSTAENLPYSSKYMKNMVMSDFADKMISLNRRIRKNVQFI
jgi:hypothetical protein